MSSEQRDAMTDEQPEPVAVGVRDGEKLLLIGRESEFDDGPFLWNDGDIEWEEKEGMVEETLFTADKLQRTEDPGSRESSHRMAEYRCIECGKSRFLSVDNEPHHCRADTADGEGGIEQCGEELMCLQQFYPETEVEQIKERERRRVCDRLDHRIEELEEIEEKVEDEYPHGAARIGRTITELRLLRDDLPDGEDGGTPAGSAHEQDGDM